LDANDIRATLAIAILPLVSARVVCRVKVHGSSIAASAGRVKDDRLGRHALGSFHRSIVAWDLPKSRQQSFAGRGLSAVDMT
jgi:hypothetical protein